MERHNRHSTSGLAKAITCPSHRRLCSFSSAAAVCFGTAGESRGVNRFSESTEHLAHFGGADFFGSGSVGVKPLAAGSSRQRSRSVRKSCSGKKPFGARRSGKVGGI